MDKNGFTYNKPKKTYMNIKIYTTQNCPYCIMAKKLLSNTNLAYEEISVENDFKKLENLIKTTHHKTVPQIFIDEKFIGGYTELKSIISQFK